MCVVAVVMKLDLYAVRHPLHYCTLFPIQLEPLVSSNHPGGVSDSIPPTSSASYIYNDLLREAWFRLASDPFRWRGL